MWKSFLILLFGIHFVLGMARGMKISDSHEAAAEALDFGNQPQDVHLSVKKAGPNMPNFMEATQSDLERELEHIKEKSLQPEKELIQLESESQLKKLKELEANSLPSSKVAPLLTGQSLKEKDVMEPVHKEPVSRETLNRVRRSLIMKAGENAMMFGGGGNSDTTHARKKRDIQFLDDPAELAYWRAYLETMDQNEEFEKPKRDDSTGELEMDDSAASPLMMETNDDNEEEDETEENGLEDDNENSDPDAEAYIIEPILQLDPNADNDSDSDVEGEEEDIENEQAAALHQLVINNIMSEARRIKRLSQLMG